MKINHPNFQNVKQKEASQEPQQPLVHTVMPPEDEQFMNQMSQVINQQGPTEAPPPPVDDVLVQQQVEKKAVLEKLVLFKQPHYHEVSVGGVKFRLKLLSAEENAKVYHMIRELPAEEQLTRSPLIMLAASLVDANGVKIEDTYEGPDIDDPMVKRYHELCKWHMPVINALVSVYSDFSSSVEEEYSKDFLGISPQTPSTD